MRLNHDKRILTTVYDGQYFYGQYGLHRCIYQCLYRVYIRTIFGTFLVVKLQMI